MSVPLILATVDLYRYCGWMDRCLACVHWFAPQPQYMVYLALSTRARRSSRRIRKMTSRTLRCATGPEPARPDQQNGRTGHRRIRRVTIQVDRRAQPIAASIVHTSAQDCVRPVSGYRDDRACVRQGHGRSRQPMGRSPVRRCDTHCRLTDDHRATKARASWWTS